MSYRIETEVNTLLRRLPIIWPKMDFGPRKFVNTTELANLIGRSTQYLEIARHEGGGPHFHKLSERAIRYSYGEVIRWLKRLKDGDISPLEIPRNDNIDKLLKDLSVGLETTASRLSKKDMTSNEVRYLLKRVNRLRRER